MVLRTFSYTLASPSTGHTIAILVEPKGLGNYNVNKPNEIAGFKGSKHEDFHKISQGEATPPVKHFTKSIFCCSEKSRTVAVITRKSTLEARPPTGDKI